MSLAMLRRLFARRAVVPGAPARPAPRGGCLEFPVVLRRRVAGTDWVIAGGPLGVIAQAIACLPVERRNEFTIGFDFPAAVDHRARPEGQS